MPHLQSNDNPILPGSPIGGETSKHLYHHLAVDEFGQPQVSHLGESADRLREIRELLKELVAHQVIIEELLMGL